MKLYEIGEKFQDVLDKAEEETCLNGYISEETAKIIEALNLNFEEKVDGIASYTKSLKAEEIAIDSEIKVLQKRKYRKRNLRESLILYLQNELIKFGKTFLETAKNQIKIRGNPESVWVADEFVNWAKTNNQERLLKFKEPEPDKIAIKEAIKNGEIFSFAHLIQTERLEIK